MYATFRAPLIPSDAFAIYMQRDGMMMEPLHMSGVDASDYELFLY